MDEKVQMLIKVCPEVKKDFKHACKANDTSVSREVRRFMKAYIEMNVSHPDTSNDAA
jgi:hypothetical protein|tara:strand:- start:1640 stop:1810 length:171 start_codon:yes stop_codon:yes gene_type:complete